ncbi:hypothetical protein ACQ4LE_007665 [Meloidogyne hapla]
MKEKKLKISDAQKASTKSRNMSTSLKLIWKNRRRRKFLNFGELKIFALLVLFQLQTQSITQLMEFKLLEMRQLPQHANPPQPTYIPPTTVPTTTSFIQPVMTAAPSHSVPQTFGCFSFRKKNTEKRQIQQQHIQSTHPPAATSTVAGPSAPTYAPTCFVNTSLQQAAYSTLKPLLSIDASDELEVQCLTQRLKELFAGHKIEFFVKGRPTNFGIPLDAILRFIQSSELEFINKLAELPVIELEGKFFWISDEFILKLLEKFSEAVDINQNAGIALFAKEDLLHRISLKNAPMEAIDWLLNNFCDKKGGGKYSFNEQKVLRIYIENLLRSLPDKALNFADFELKINNTLPNGLYFKEEYLSGLGIIENSHFRGKVVNKLIATDLPLNLQERLSILFSKKSHWRKEEIQPYLLEYCLDPAKIEEFLMKNCKIVGSSSERFLPINN